MARGGRCFRSQQKLQPNSTDRSHVTPLPPKSPKLRQSKSGEIQINNKNGQNAQQDQRKCGKAPGTSAVFHHARGHVTARTASLPARFHGEWKILQHINEQYPGSIPAGPLAGPLGKAPAPPLLHIPTASGGPNPIRLMKAEGMKERPLGPVGVRLLYLCR